MPWVTKGRGCSRGSALRSRPFRWHKIASEDQPFAGLCNIGSVIWRSACSGALRPDAERERMSLSNRPGLLITAGLVAVVVGCGSPGPAPVGAATITTQPASTTVVAGAAATFVVAATGNGALSYQWRKDGADVSAGA